MSRWLKSPWIVVAATVVPTVLMLQGVSVPAGYYGSLMASVVCWALVGVAWLAVGVSAFRALPAPRVRRVWRLWPLLIVPIVFADGLGLASDDKVGRAAFAEHRAEMQRLAEAEATMPSFGHGDVGSLYTFESVYRAGGCVLFAVRDPGVARSAGFAWCPERAPMGDTFWDSEGFAFEPFEDDWYVFIVGYREPVRTWGFQPGALRAPPEH